MADPAKIIARVRTLGGDIVLDGDRLFIANRSKLPTQAIQFIEMHAKEIAAVLQAERAVEIGERAAIIEYDGHVPREWAEQFAQILISRKPKNVDEGDWAWFLTACGRIIDEAPRRVA